MTSCQPIPAEPVVRIVVDRADAPRCGLRVGDFVEICGSTLRLPGTKPFCLYALAAALPVVALRQVDGPPDHWLERKPWTCCPDPSEGVVLRLDRPDRHTAVATEAS